MCPRAGLLGVCADGGLGWPLPLEGGLYVDRGPGLVLIVINTENESKHLDTFIAVWWNNLGWKNWNIYILFGFCVVSFLLVIFGMIFYETSPRARLET